MIKTSPKRAYFHCAIYNAGCDHMDEDRKHVLSMLFFHSISSTFLSKKMPLSFIHSMMKGYSYAY